MADESAAADSVRLEGRAVTDVSVGMSGEITQVVLPGSRLIAKPVDPRTTPIVIRIDGVYPHGDDYRYDITWFGMAPGDHNLTDYLAREDGTSTADLPAIPVTVHSILSPERLMPNAPSGDTRAAAGGYRRWLWFGGFLWICGLAWILAAGRIRAGRSAGDESETPLSRLEQIELLIADATGSSQFTPADKARLEGLIVGFWRERKDLVHLGPKEALETLRRDPDAGPLLKQLERWLYDRPESADEALAAALKPLRRMMDDAARAEESGPERSHASQPAGGVTS